MTAQQLVDEVLRLSLPERVEVAQAVWQSIHDAPGVDSTEYERELVAEAWRRDAELTSGAAVGRSHEEVMASSRRLLGCE